MTSGVLSSAILGGIAQALERFLPLDAGLININNPSEALVLALAGTLSTSAFIFPVIKERGWEEETVGQAATSILLLQDLFVAPLLVLLPFIVGQGVTDPGAVAELTAKATLGFGSVLVIGSWLLRRLFEVVASSRSSDTFVALSLFVAAGMGAVAKDLGLTDTAGAFAAGVLLANSNYKYEIFASILPFKGILLGIFFLDAGSNFDPDLLVREGPTIATGVVFLLVLKALTLFLAGYIDKALPTATSLSPAENVRLAVLLSGGGEFAFVIFAAADKLGALPDELNALLTTIILITMSITPLLGGLAASLSEPFESMRTYPGWTLAADLPDASAERGQGAMRAAASDVIAANVAGEAPSAAPLHAAHDAIVICGYGEVGSLVSDTLLEAAEAVIREGEGEALTAVATTAATTDGGSGGGGGGGSGGSGSSGGGARERSSASSGSGSGSGGASIVCFDLNPQRLPRIRTRDGALVMYGDGANAELVRLTGVSSPRAIIVTYQEPARCLAATSRLRAAFPEAPIYTRASSTREQQALLAGGASVTILETRELACQLGACLFLDETSFSLRRDLPLGGRAGDDEKLSVWETAVRALRAVAASSAPLNATGAGEDK
jgi:Kef-type K+ transport system membrane component KefB